VNTEKRYPKTDSFGRKRPQNTICLEAYALLAFLQNLGYSKVAGADSFFILTT